MKRYYFPILWAVLSALFSSCEQHYTMFTEIRPDGSCFRQIGIVTRDSAFLTGDTTCNPYPFLLTPEWQIEVHRNTTAPSEAWPLAEWSPKDSAYVTASRNFSSIEELNRQFRFNRGAWKGIQPEVSLKKSFRWFYTYYTFSEKYPQISSQEIPIPLERYMTPEEQIIWFQNASSISKGMNGREIYGYLEKMETKATAWTNHNLFMLNYAVILTFFENKNDNPFSGRLIQARDSIYATTPNKEDFLTNNLITILDSYFKTNYFSTQYHNQQQEFDSLSEAKLQILNIFEPQFKYELLLPGKVLSTNAARYEKDKLIWQLNAYNFLPADYVLTAESRKLNLWTIFVTLLVIGGLVYKTIR